MEGALLLMLLLPSPPATQRVDGAVQLVLAPAIPFAHVFCAQCQAVNIPSVVEQSHHAIHTGTASPSCVGHVRGVVVQ